MTDDVEIAALVADAFDLGSPTAPLFPLRHVSQEAWRLDTTAGPTLVKRFWSGPEVPWRADLERAMAFEARALSAGIDTPTPIPPRTPQFGAAAQIDGHGVFRAYPYLQHRPLEPSDDITDWVGSTLARIQLLEPPLPKVPAPNWWYNQFPTCPPEQWEDWRQQGNTQQKAWAPVLERNVDVILERSRHILDVFADTAPHVQTHRDLEPWNILMVPNGDAVRPMLIDWDVAGSDSAGLEAAHVLTTFARHGQDEPDPDRTRRGIDAYLGAGGAEMPVGPDRLARYIGMRLARIAQRISVSLGAELSSVDSAAAEDQARARIEEFPALIEKSARWGELLSSRI